MLVALAATVGVDQASKALVVASVERGETVNVFLGLDITNVRNTGIAFGAFAGAGAEIVVVSSLALVALLAYFAFNASARWLWLPVGLVLGGAVANLVDRARIGAVVDFIDPVAWPAFNLADTAIVIGVLGLLYVVEEESRRAKARAREEAPAEAAGEGHPAAAEAAGEAHPAAPEAAGEEQAPPAGAPAATAPHGRRAAGGTRPHGAP